MLPQIINIDISETQRGSPKKRFKRFKMPWETSYLYNNILILARPINVMGLRLLSYRKKHVVEDNVLFTNHLAGK